MSEELQNLIDTLETEDNARVSKDYIIAACASGLDTIEQLTKERDELEIFRSAVMGWRENDWPEAFCRATADLVGDRAKHAVLEHELVKHKEG